MATKQQSAELAGTRQEYLQVHRWMCLSKALDDRMHILVKQGRAPFVGSARGHEGIQVCAVAPLDRTKDWLVPHYRGLGSAVAMGLTAREWMLAAGDGMAGAVVDGSDVPAAYAACKEAVERARRGEGPTLLEARIRRINSHTSEDNQGRYRTPEDIQEALAFDPIPKFERWLVERGWLTAESAERIRAEYEADSAEAADWAEQEPDPRPEDIGKNVYEG